MDLFNAAGTPQLKLKRPLAFFDLETTGIDITTEKIVEIAILKLMPDGKLSEYLAVCNPGKPIPKEASDVHGFTDEMVKDKPLFETIAIEVGSFLEGCDFCGFNSNRFDVPLLVEEMLRCGIDLEIEKRSMVDVQRIYHKLERRNLEAAYKYYCKKDLENAHSAMADVKATYEVLLAQLVMYPTELKNEVAALEKFVDDGKIVDVARRLVEKQGKVYFNFGKHKDVPVSEVLKREPNYYDWVMKSDFPLHTKFKLREIKMALK
jgi:DNA polymerase III subunit epsilon